MNTQLAKTLGYSLALSLLLAALCYPSIYPRLKDPAPVTGTVLDIGGCDSMGTCGVSLKGTARWRCLPFQGVHCSLSGDRLECHVPITKLHINIDKDAFVRIGEEDQLFLVLQEQHDVKEILVLCCEGCELDVRVSYVEGPLLFHINLNPAADLEKLWIHCIRHAGLLRGNLDVFLEEKDGS